MISKLDLLMLEDRSFAGPTAADPGPAMGLASIKEKIDKRRQTKLSVEMSDREGMLEE